MSPVNEGSRFYLAPIGASTSGISYSCLYSQPQSDTTLWPVLSSRPAKGRRLSWPEWLVTCRGGLPVRTVTVTHQSTNRDRRRLTSFRHPMPLLLRQIAMRSCIILWLLVLPRLPKSHANTHLLAVDYFWRYLILDLNIMFVTVWECLTFKFNTLLQSSRNASFFVT